LFEAATQNEEVAQIAGYSIEFWNTLCEEEIEHTKKNQQFDPIMKNFNWQPLALQLFNGL
jgi:hypothetical protein